MGESLTGLKRSCMCCNVNENMIGQEVTVMGWVQRRRDLGQLIFIALRDKTGLVQIAIDGNTAEKELFAKAETVRSEYVLAVKGLVAARTEGNINPNMKTGKIEIIAKELRILSESETTPFQIEDNITVKDDGVALTVEVCADKMYIKNCDKGGNDELKFCRMLFLILSEITGITPVWGLQTGVRPTKLLRKNIQKQVIT